MERKRIMIVDSNELFRRMAGAAIESNHYLVTNAEDGRDALRALDLQVPDLIILNPELPRVDGITFLARLRGNPNWRMLPVILVAAADLDPGSIKHAQALRVDAVLIRGRFAMKDLVNEVRLALDRQDARFAAALELSQPPPELATPAPGTIAPDTREVVHPFSHPLCAPSGLMQRRLHSGEGGVAADRAGGVIREFTIERLNRWSLRPDHG